MYRTGSTANIWRAILRAWSTHGTGNESVLVWHSAQRHGESQYLQVRRHDPHLPCWHAVDT